MIALLASVLLAVVEPEEQASRLLPADVTAAQLVESCRTMIPSAVEVSGRIVLRNRRGIVQSEHAYTLARTNGVTNLTIDGTRIDPPDSSLLPHPSSLLGTDVTWSDIALDYLWWNDFAYDAEKESETVHGQLCRVVVMKNGDRTVRVWVDRKTGAMMQAEEMQDGKAVRRLWGTRIKKFDGRWMPSQLEVETLGSGHRTKITVEEMKT